MSPDNLAALAATVRAHWGEHGYHVVALTTYANAGAIHVRHSDGSRFIVAVDQYGCHYTHATDHPYNVQGTDWSQVIAQYTTQSALEAHAAYATTPYLTEYRPDQALYADHDEPAA